MGVATVVVMVMQTLKRTMADIRTGANNDVFILFVRIIVQNKNVSKEGGEYATVRFIDGSSWSARKW
eukprot:3977824-Ditylum_brightwellii.AAC.1